MASTINPSTPVGRSIFEGRRIGTMTLQSQILTAFLSFSLLICPFGAEATDWQAYQTANTQASEIDADSVRVVDGLVHYSYRTRFLREPMVGDTFGHAIDAVADCEGRRNSDVVKGVFEFRTVYEDTQAAFQIDLACRLAGRPYKTHASAKVAAEREWIVYSDQYGMRQKIDAKSVEIRGGLVFFQYMRQYGAQQGDLFDGVVDCAGRKSADVSHGTFELKDVRDGTTIADQAAVACRLAKLSFEVHALDPDAD